MHLIHQQGLFSSRFFKVTKTWYTYPNSVFGVMQWVGHVWHENTSVIIGAQTGAFMHLQGSFMRRFSRWPRRDKNPLDFWFKGVEWTCSMRKHKFHNRCTNHAFSAPTRPIFCRIFMVTKYDRRIQTWFLCLMNWIGHVWRQTRSFIIGTRTGAFNAPTVLIFVQVLQGDWNMRYMLKLNFFDVKEWLGHISCENTSFIIGSRTGAFTAHTGPVFASVFQGIKYIPKLSFWM